MVDLCHCLPQILWETSGPCTWRSHHRKTCSTRLRSWRGSGLFSPVSASGVLRLWCLGKHMGRTLFDFGFCNLLQVFSRLLLTNVMFDGKFVSLPQILWETSGPCTWRSHHRKTCSTPLRSDVEVACSLLSLHLGFCACDVWENTWVEHCLILDFVTCCKFFVGYFWQT